MSRKRPDIVYRVFPEKAEPVVVIARHPKGALGVARAHGVSVTAATPVQVVHEALAPEAINATAPEIG